MIKFRSILLVIILFLPAATICQSWSAFEYAYRNWNDYKNDKPLYKASFKFIPKDISEFHAEYKVKVIDLKISNKEINYGIWIIKDEGCVYLNGVRQGLQCGFLKIPTGERYHYFMAKPMYNSMEQAKINNSTNMFGLAGAAVTSNMIDSENVNKYHHVFDLEEGVIYRLTKEYIVDLLQNYPLLLTEFLNTENNGDIEVLKTYLEILNSID